MGQYSAIPRSKDDIRELAVFIRKILGISSYKPFPVMYFMERIILVLHDDFVLDIVPDHYLRRELAKTYPEKHIVMVRQSVYDKACAGDGFSLLVIAHELGHYLMHTNQDICFAKSISRERMPKEYNVEWQAEIFAYELMMPFEHVKKLKTAKAVSRQFGVNAQIAKKRLTFVNKEIKKVADEQKRKTKSYKKRFGQP